MLYEHKERGVDQGSEMFQATPSKLAKSVLFYPHRCGHFICNRDYLVQRKNYNNYLIIFVEKGRMEIENVGKTYVANQGDIALINCHFPHTYSALENATVFSFLHFNGSNIDKFYEQILARHQAVFPLHPDSLIPGKIRQLLELLRQNESTGGGLMAENQLACSIHDILCGMLFANNESGDYLNSSGNSLVTQAIQYIRSHYAEPIDVRGIADWLNISQFHFTRLFKQEVGCPPHEYLTLFRIQRSKELLQGTNLSIAEIAAAVGYEYSTSFTAVFQRRVGSSPKDFRNSLF